MSAAVLDMDQAEQLERASQLLDLWSSLSLQHVALGGACGCGMGGVSLRLDDFELDIVDYLVDAGVRSGVQEVADFFSAWQAHAQEGSALGARSGPLRRLLAQVGRARMPGPVADWLLPRVERTLHSYRELHGPRLGG